MFRRTLGQPGLFAIIYTVVAAALYFSLGVVARARARADAGRLPRRRPVLPAGGDDVRRGRVAAPGPRGRDGLRPLRLQRARELHRRLGDGARLRDPAVGHGVHGDALPGRVLGADRPRGARERRRARDPRLGRVAEHPRLRAARACSASRRWSSSTSLLQVVVVVVGLGALLRAGPITDSIDLGDDADLGRRDLRASASRPSSSPGSSRRPACRASCGSGGAASSG